MTKGQRVDDGLHRVHALGRQVAEEEHGDVQLLGREPLGLEARARGVDAGLGLMARGVRQIEGDEVAHGGRASRYTLK